MAVIGADHLADGDQRGGPRASRGCLAGHHDPDAGHRGTRRGGGPAEQAAPAEVEESSSTEDAPYGEGSHAPLADGGQPTAFPFRATTTRSCTTGRDVALRRTVAEVWFASADAAEAAGFSCRPRSGRTPSRARRPTPDLCRDRSGRAPASGGWTISYDGTDFSGWAVQTGRRTVCGVLTETLSTVVRGRFVDGGRP